MQRLAIAVSREYDHYHPDDLPLVELLPRRGFRPEPCVWNDPNVDWSAFDAVLVRTIWDYYRRYPEYLSWLNRLERSGARVVNPVPVLRWNADKRYLLELEAGGIAVIAGRVLERGTVADAFAAAAADDIVVKPTISAGAFRTLRITRADAETHEAELAELLRHSAALVQPYVAEVATAGEWSLMFFGGAYSHAVHKRPRSGDFRVQEKHGGVAEAAEPSRETIGQASAMIAALAELGHAGLTYARIDGVVIDGRLRLMEAELIEPQLFLSGQPHAAANFARALSETLRVF
jgi:glutathione synthase/RimK-type ligase-like ATP-grasp enzyme